MFSGGVLKVHDNVTFEAKAAELRGAVSLPFKIDFHFPDVVWCFATGCQDRLDSLRQLTKRRRQGR